MTRPKPYLNLLSRWQWLGYVLAVAVLWGFFPEQVRHFAHADASTVYGAALSVSASMLGFVLTAMSVLVTTIPASPRFKPLVGTPALTDLWAVFSRSLMSLGLTTLASLFGLLFDSGWPSVTSFVVSLFVALSVGTLNHAMNVFLKAVVILSKPEDPPAPVPDVEKEVPVTLPTPSQPAPAQPTPVQPPEPAPASTLVDAPSAAACETNPETVPPAPAKRPATRRNNRSRS